MFLGLLLVFSGAFYAFLFFVPDAPKRWLSLSGAFMWCPGVAALLTQLALHRNLRGFGWRPGGWRFHLLAYAVPLGFCVPVYAFVWMAGLGGFEAVTKHTDRRSFFTYEYGIGFALVIPVIAYLFWRKRGAPQA